MPHARAALRRAGEALGWARRAGPDRRRRDRVDIAGGGPRLDGAHPPPSPGDAGRGIAPEGAVAPPGLKRTRSDPARPSGHAPTAWNPPSTWRISPVVM